MDPYHVTTSWTWGGPVIDKGLGSSMITCGKDKCSTELSSFWFFKDPASKIHPKPYSWSNHDINTNEPHEQETRIFASFSSRGPSYVGQLSIRVVSSKLLMSEKTKSYYGSRSKPLSVKYQPSKRTHQDGEAFKYHRLPNARVTVPG